MDNVSFQKQVSSDTFFEKDRIVMVSEPSKVCMIDKGQSLKKGQVLTVKGVERKKKKRKKKQPWWYKDIMKEHNTMTDEECRKKQREKLRNELMVEKKRKVDFI